MVGLDTGFFFRRVEQHERAVEVYGQIQRGEEEGAVSAVVLFEVLRHTFRGALPQPVGDELLDAAGVGLVLAGTDDPRVVRRGAAISHGMGLAMADSLIAASFEEAGCRKIYTTDTDLLDYEGPLEVELLQPNGG